MSGEDGREDLHRVRDGVGGDGAGGVQSDESVSVSNSGEMKVSKCLLACIVAASIAVSPSPADAVVVTIDQFAVDRNGAAFFRDGFQDGSPPPSAPNLANGSATFYYVGGTLPAGAESGGRLRLDSQAGAVLSNDGQFIETSQYAVLANSLVGTDTFAVSGVFDRVENAGPLYSGYGIGLTGPNLEIGLQIAYSVALAGNVIRFYSRDIVNGVYTVLYQSLIAPPQGTDQFALSLLRGDPNSFDVFAELSFLDDGGLLQTLMIGTPGVVFQGETSYQPFFFAASVQQIPEPGTISLALLGLAGIAAVRRRRR